MAGGQSVSMRSVIAALTLLASGGPWGAPSAAWAAEARLADAVLAEIGPSPVMLSDVALARALGTLGLDPATGPVTEAEVAHYLDAQLAVREAAQIGVEVSAADVDREWQAAGGAALGSRLAAVGIDPSWARRVIEDDLRVEGFVDRRFRAFAFVSEFDVDAALGAGEHDEAARARARDRLRAEMVTRALTDWTKDARQRAAVRRVGPPGPWPAPFSLAPRAGAR
jgi:hypothetical protein